MRFGEFDLDVATGELRKSGRTLKLAPQPAKLLMLLARRAGELVTREEIRHEIWGAGTFVDFDQSLHSAIKQIRQALGDDSDNPRFIETLPRRGYRFVGRAEPVRLRWRIPAAAAVILLFAALLMRPHPPASPRVMMAVLPFQNLDPDPSREFFSDGLTEEMITQLGRLEPKRLGVIARTSAMQYKGTAKTAARIARELGVRYLLEGTVRREGGRVRIAAELVDAADQTSLWSDSYESDLSDLLAIQANVARRIAGALEIELLPPRAAAAIPRSEALEEYYRGRFLWNKRNEESFRKSIVHFERAIALDRGFAPAWAGLADAWNLLGEYHFEAPTGAFPKARAAAEKALALDPGLAEAWTSLGCVRSRFDWDWKGAEQAYRTAIERNPGYATAHQWYAELLATMGRFDEADVEIRSARQHDPFSLIIPVAAASIDYFARRYDDAIRECAGVLEMDPEFAPARQYLASAYEQQGRYAEALATRRRGWAPLRNAHALAGIRTAAPGELARMVRQPETARNPSYVIATIYAALGDKDHAFAWLDRAYRERDSTLAYARVHPSLDSLRSDPRFEALLRRIGL